MLKQENRLRKAADIQKIFARGRTFFNPFFTIKFFSSLKEKQFTVVVSTKVYKNAVSRNRLKRIVREYVRKNLGQFKNGTYMIIAKPKVNRLPEKEFLPAFLDVCARLR